ncbi:MAG: DAK2 domain-containing protein, partial [Bacillota bacterium]|nr:DAK2 domain-containing protein [Bacillota bacterium]
STIETLSSAELRDFFRMGEAVLSQNSDRVNALNVFPVPDGDTGTNMGLTIKSAIKNLDESMGLKEICATVSRGALMGARGNSGVILSQILRGFTMSLQNQSVIDASALAVALQKGVEVAYKSVLKPVEGTILTVSRHFADAAVESASHEKDMVVVMSHAMEAGKKALENTPNQLPVLKEAGVVDSGGQGFMYIMQGCLLALEGKGLDSLPKLSDLSDVPDKTAAFSAEIQESEITYRYCTELMIHNANKSHEAVRSELEQRDGDSLVVVGDEGIIKVHFHTNDPGKIISYALTVGELFDIKVENMKEQMAREAREKKEAEAARAAAVAKEPQKTCGIIAVAAGDGMAEIFKSLGADEVISGGQTMNPSAEDIMACMDKVNAKEIVILPNNSNIILAAQQVVSMAEQPVSVVPSKYITQGLSALLQFNSEASAEENAEEMTASLDAVKNGEVTYAIRDTSVNGIEIKANDILCLMDGEIVCANASLNDAVLKLVEAMSDEDASLLTLYYGEDVTEEAANEMAEVIGEQYSDLDIEVYQGGQPLYYYLISLE